MGETVSSRDLVRVLDVIGALHEGGHDSEVSDDGLMRLGRLVGCDSAGCSWVLPPLRQVVDAVTDRPDRNPFGDPLFQSLVRHHPGFAAYESGGLRLGSSVALTDLVPTRELRTMPLYAEIYQPRGTLDQLVCGVRLHGRFGSVLTFNRSRYGFSGRDRALVDLVAPHIAQAMACRDRLITANGTDRADQPDRPAAAVLSLLTTRERQIAEHVSTGATDRQIARQLDISHRTVHKHLEQIFRKLGLPNRASLITLWCNQNG